MFVRLKEKPFYFLTDRQTKYTYLVDNTTPKPQKQIYYPDQFQTMSAAQIRKCKWDMVSQLMRWSLFNRSKMTVTDQKICMSKWLDLGLSLFTGLLLGSFLRRALFRIEMPFFDMAFEKSLFNSRWIKSVSAYSVAGIFIFSSLKPILKEQFLVDLALEYKYNFNKSLTCKELDQTLTKLCQQRFQKKQELPTDKEGSG